MVKAFEWLLRRFSVDVGIDLGTANTLVSVRDKGIVLDEPSVVAVRKGTNEVLLDGMAVGDAAIEYLGRTPPGFQAVRPMKSGVIADFEVTEKMLRYFIAKATGSRRVVKPRVVRSDQSFLAAKMLNSVWPETSIPEASNGRASRSSRRSKNRCVTFGYASEHTGSDSQGAKVLTIASVCGTKRVS